MSITTYANEPNPALWDYYLLDCRANELRPSLKDYLIWCEENSGKFDIDEPDWDDDGRLI